MKRACVEMKAGLTKLTYDVVGELLDWMEDTPRLTPTQIVEVVLKLRHWLSERRSKR